MRYWFDEIENTLFALDGPPPDGKGKIEISEEDFKAYQKQALLNAKAQVDAEEEAPPTQPVQQTTTVDMEKLARVWRKMQDARDKLSHDFKLADLEIENQQDQIGAALLEAMNKMGGTKLTAAAGVVEKKTKMQVSGKDWDAIYRWIAENDAWGVLHKRLSSTFVEEWVEKHKGELPPGISVFNKFVISVKKPGAKSPPTDEV